ncbi:unnamed protein product [Urochloa humidicola]
MATSIVSVALLLSALGAVLPAARSTISSLPVVDPLPHDATNYSSPWPVVNFADLAAGNHSADYHALSCPSLEYIVTVEVDVAIERDYSIAAGLIRIYFNDCFPQGCDASLLLKGPWSEERFPPNAFLNQKAMRLIEDIRIIVHRECGPTVSCSDILALAACRAFVIANGYNAKYHVQLGRYDNVAPAIMGDVIAIPLPQSNIDTLLNDFASRGLDASDLVALSGAHSIGKAHCESFRDRAAQYNTDFTRKLFWDCRRDANAVEDLDHVTPQLLDNQYYKNLYKGEGVFTSDMALLNHPETAKWVKYYNDYPPIQFLIQFASRMEKLYYVPKGGYGEIRRFTCFRSNMGWLADQAQGADSA